MKNRPPGNKDMYQISAPLKKIELDFLLPFRRIAENRCLFAMLMRNDLKAKFKNSILGFLWLFIPPVCILLIYVYIFSIIFRMRWPEENLSSRWGFGLMIYAGITVYSAFSDSIGGSLNLLTSRAGMLKRVPFPFELLSVSHVCANILTSGVILWVLFGLSLLTGGSGSWTALLYFPLIYLPYLLFCIGASWICSTLSVFFRDIGNLLSIILLLLFFASPVIYSARMVPENLLWIIRWNPLTPVVTNIRCIFLQNTAPGLYGLLWSWISGLLVFQLGFCFFLRMERRFSDVI